MISKMTDPEWKALAKIQKKIILLDLLLYGIVLIFAGLYLFTIYYP
jgi:hypothetical protein